jgi:hypothetical protein
VTETRCGPEANLPPDWGREEEIVLPEEQTPPLPPTEEGVTSGGGAAAGRGAATGRGAASVMLAVYYAILSNEGCFGR